MCAGVLRACISVYHIRAVNVEAKGGMKWPGTGTAAGFEVSCGCLRSNPGHPAEQPAIFATDPPVVLFLRQDLSPASEAGQPTPGTCLSLAHLQITSTDVFHNEGAAIETERPPVVEGEALGRILG